MPRKRDIKQFRQACKEAGLTPKERYEASEALHAEKESSGVQDHMSYGELVAWLRQWEAALMATVVALDASPANVLRSMRGSIIDARKAYPGVLHVEIRDSSGELWRLATQDADWSPSNPQELVGQAIENAEIDESSGELRCKLSNGSVLGVRPAPHEAGDDPPNWELITPDGLVLEFGPGGRWLLDRADEPVSALDRVGEQEFAQIRRREEIFSSRRREADSVELSMLRHAELRASIAIGASVGSGIAALAALVAALR